MFRFMSTSTSRFVIRAALKLARASPSRAIVGRGLGCRAGRVSHLPRDRARVLAAHRRGLPSRCHGAARVPARQARARTFRSRGCRRSTSAASSRHCSASNGAATISRKLSSVRAFCRFLVKRGVLAGNPGGGDPRPEEAASALPRALDVDDAFRLVEAPPRPAAPRTARCRRTKTRAMGCCGYATPRCSSCSTGTGLRVSEPCALDTDRHRSRSLRRADA